MQDAALWILMMLVYPLWVAAGFADWCCHRATDIARTSGLKESLMHWLMFAEIGVGMLAVVLLDTNGALLLIVALVFVVHEATVYWDLDYTTVLRDVAPFEQMVHSFLELLPLVSLALLAVAAGPQWDELALRTRAQAWPAGYLATAFGLALVFNVLPLLQELWSCWRVRALRRRTRVSPAPR